MSSDIYESDGVEEDRIAAEEPADLILEVSGLKTTFPTDRGVVNAVNEISYTIREGETFGFVGESGAGKSVTGLSVMQLVDSPGEIEEGSVQFKGQDLLEMTEEERRSLRGNEIAMVFQDSMTSLNPSYTVGTQIIDVIREHQDLDKGAARNQAISLLEDVQIPNASERIDEYPHQFSGGMRQRALIAMALSCNPDLLICDEPTTALDVTTQREILDLLKELQKEYNLSIQLITHDMGVIAYMCDRVGVMYAGELIEVGELEDLFNHAAHPYTVGLMNAIPRPDALDEKLETIPGSMPDLVSTPSGCSFRTRCDYAIDDCAATDPELDPVEGATQHRAACIRTNEIDLSSDRENRVIERKQSKEISDEKLLTVENVRKYFHPESQSWLDRIYGRHNLVHAVDNISFDVYGGETLGLVGESGCGKTTLGRTISQLYQANSGRIVYAGQELTDLDRDELREARSNFQVIFQDPFASLNPRKTVKNIIGRPMLLHDVVDTKKEMRERVIELLEEVGLEANHVDRYAHEFSGGQRQRIGIARALAVEPDFIIADEPVSALDVSVQAQILNLLEDLQDRYDITYMFIAHDLNVVQYISDRIAVMYLGEIVEVGTVEEVTQPPYHPYTEVLLSSILQPSAERQPDAVELQGQLPSPSDPPSACRFHTRCPYASEECRTHKPKEINVGDGHRINCHLLDDERMTGRRDEVEEILANQDVTFER